MKNNKLNIIIIIVCAVLVVGLCTFLIINHKLNEPTDSEKFKKEFENYNSYVNPNTNEEFLTVNINADNPIIYKTDKEIMDILKNENALILFGYPSSITNRSVIETLLDAASDAKIDEIYYVDISDIIDMYEYTSKNTVTRSKEGSETFKEIVDFLDNYIENLYLLDLDGNLFDTGYKTLKASTFVAVSKGEVVGFHEGAIAKGETKELTTNEKEELKSIYLEIMNNWIQKTSVCTSSSTAC